MIVVINSEKCCVLEGTRVPEGGVEKSHICNSFILLNYKKKKSNGISNEDKILTFTVKESSFQWYSLFFDGTTFCQGCGTSKNEYTYLGAFICCVLC